MVSVFFSVLGCCFMFAYCLWLYVFRHLAGFHFFKFSSRGQVVVPGEVHPCIVGCLQTLAQALGSLAKSVQVGLLDVYKRQWSHSARSAWIETGLSSNVPYLALVALRKECVD